MMMVVMPMSVCMLMVSALLLALERRSIKVHLNVCLDKLRELSKHILQITKNPVQIWHAWLVVLSLISLSDIESIVLLMLLSVHSLAIRHIRVCEGT